MCRCCSFIACKCCVCLVTVFIALPRILLETGAMYRLLAGLLSRRLLLCFALFLALLILLAVLYKQAEQRDFLRISSISLVVSGAIGNLYDRVRWDRGVVDFLGPVDLGLWNFPIFNVADMAITCGAVLLAISFWLEEQEERAREAAAQAALAEGG